MFGLLLALTMTQLGGVCDPTPGGDPGAAPATFLCTPSNVDEGPGEIFDIAVKFDTTANVQAVELDIEWDPANVKYLSSGPHPDFDDDGQFFTPAILDEVDGSLRGIRDVRHGVSTVSGNKGVITLQFRVETSTASTIVATGRVANEQGIQSESLIATCYISPGPL